MSKNFKQEIVSGVFWQAFERIGNFGIRFLITIILARLLAPSEFGVIAIMLVFVSLLNVITDSGFTIALIQKKDIDQQDCCSVFYINIFISFIMYFVIYMLAPWINDYYNTAGLTLYLRTFSLIVVIRSFSLIQSALLRKRMLFRLSFKISWVSLIVSGSIGIVMAYFKCGVWSLIAQQITNAIVSGIMLWTLVKWRPSFLFDYARISELFRFGWKVFIANLLDAAYKDLYTLIIGKISDMETLSFYDRGKHYPKLVMDIITATVGAVTLPAFSKIQSDRGKMRQLAKEGINNIMYVVIPVLTFLFVFSDLLIKLILTEKWLPCTYFLRLSCIIYFFWPFDSINSQVVTAIGRSDVILFLEIIKKIQFVLIIVLTYKYGVATIVAVSAFFEFVIMIEYGLYNIKTINYSPFQELFDISPHLLIGILSGFISYVLSRCLRNDIISILIAWITFTFIYFGVSLLLKTIPQTCNSLLNSFAGKIRAKIFKEK